MQQSGSLMILEDESMINTTVIYCPCPSVNDHKEDYRRKKKFFKLDNELMSNFKFWISCIAYTFVLAMICSHNITTKAFWQNQAVKSTIYDTFKVLKFNMYFFCHFLAV